MIRSGINGFAKQARSRVELHVHLDGAVRPSTIWELAQGDLQAIYRVAYEFCEDSANQGIAYVEARYSPHLLATTVPDSPWKVMGDVTPKMVVETVSKGLSQGEKDFNIKVRQILCCIRPFPDWSSEVVYLCQEFRSKGVVGIDLAGDESQPTHPDHKKAFQEAARLGISRTVHAAEAGPASNAKAAVYELLAQRIGHGYHTVEDEAIYQDLRARDIHFEVCLLSSQATGAVTLDWSKHPAIRFANDDLNFSLNTDDPTVIQNTLGDEYDVGFNKLHFSERVLARTNFNAARSCFLPRDEKDELLNHLKEQYGLQECCTRL
ncbi:PREDICTED: adenosine deaminase-like isoform X2 [Priapulus caudatus]|uniref:Adenosine deaminase n=1 Tax=Priapulus caudatus TaxID=37621 RepID=A0ABM1E5Z8_PRICU|nr:PREDICTED: adenosine deaminase-like isoform X2 [Priapulus caudatus]